MTSSVVSHGVDDKPIVRVLLELMFVDVRNLEIRQPLDRLEPGERAQTLHVLEPRGGPPRCGRGGDPIVATNVMGPAAFLGPAGLALGCSSRLLRCSFSQHGSALVLGGFDHTPPATSVHSRDGGRMKHRYCFARHANC